MSKNLVDKEYFSRPSFKFTFPKLCIIIKKVTEIFSYGCKHKFYINISINGPVTTASTYETN